MATALSEGGGLMQQGQYAEVVKRLQPLAALHCEPRVSLLLAAALEGTGNAAAANKTLEEAHTLWPANNSIAASLAREWLAAGSVDEAAKALDHFHATPDTPAQESNMAVVVLLASHQLVPAQQIAEVNYQSHPALQPLLLLANTLQLEGRYKDVLTLLEAQRKTYQTSPSFLITVAESEYDDKILDGARRDLEAAIALDPKLYQAHYLLGNVLLNLSIADRAADEYRVAIELAPKQPRSYYQLALALRAQQDEAGEESILRKAIALDSRYALAHSVLGRILMNWNRLQEAVTELNLSIAQNPSSEQAYYLLAKAYERLGDTADSDEMTKRLASVKLANRARQAVGGAGAVGSDSSAAGAAH